MPTLWKTTIDDCSESFLVALVQFQVVDRQGLFVDGDSNALAIPVGEARAPEAWETGFKDTVTAYPGQVTRIRAQFNTPGQFVWHCHIVEHEDNEMMVPYCVGTPGVDCPEELF